MNIKMDVLFQDFSTIPEITQQIRQENIERIFTGGVRINLGKYRTAKEDAEYREKSLKRKLP